jgi:hypothetical protein
MKSPTPAMVRHYNEQRHYAPGDVPPTYEAGARTADSGLRPYKVPTRWS